MHLDLLGALPLAGLAAAALDVEAEPAGLVAADLRLARLGEELADQVEHARVRRRVAARRPADGRLVDLDDLVDLRDAEDLLVLAGLLARLVEPPLQRPEQNLVDQRALARSGDARDADEAAQREFDVDVLEVVFAARP